MFATSTLAIRRSILTTAVAGLVLFTLGRGYADGQAVPPAKTHQHSAVAKPAEQPPAKLVVDQPRPEALARGVAILTFRTEKLKIVPVFDPEATVVSPRIGHLHVTVDDAPWHWAHTSEGPVIVAPLAPGPHKILIELADANHKVLVKEVVKFDVPKAPPRAVPTSEKQKADEDFLTRVVPGIAASVQIIEYAARNASDEAVKDFAGRVAKQHKASVEAATAHAKRLNIAVVTDPDTLSKPTIDKLSKLKGTDLDAAFLNWLGDIHADATAFEDEVKNGGDAELKAYASGSITAGHEHLHEARAILAKLKK